MIDHTKHLYYTEVPRKIPIIFKIHNLNALLIFLPRIFTYLEDVIYYYLYLFCLYDKYFYLFS